MLSGYGVNELSELFLFISKYKYNLKAKHKNPIYKIEVNARMDKLNELA